LLLWRLPEPMRGAADGLAQAPVDPHPFQASLGVLSAILPIGIWLRFLRLRAPIRDWVINSAALAVIVLGSMWMTQWTNALRKMPPPPLKLGGMLISGNALQWIVVGFGCYAVVNWLQVLRLQDKPAFALIAKTPSLVLLFALAALQSVVNYGVMAWSASFIIKSYHLSPAEVGLQFGALSGGIGVLGPLIAGPLSDRFARQRSGGRFYVTLFALGLSPFLAFWTYHADTVSAFYLRFTLYSVVLTMWLPAVYAGFMDLVVPRMRGAVMSFYILTMTIAGLGIGPYAVGLISDIDGGHLGDAILSVYWLGPVLVGLIIGIIVLMPRDEATMLDRARAAGEPV
jgi:MFS transporter, Spinster family, sphingosine-1-phosphate transporter